MLIFITVILAFCSIVYELLLAQSLSATMGNTVARYNITIAFYIVALGTGVLIYRKFGFTSTIKRLINVELLLAFMGLIAPSCIILFDYLANNAANHFAISYHSAIIQFPLFIADYGLVFIIGLLSGFELPLLMDMGDEQNQKKPQALIILASDYMGTMLGAIAFPLILLPFLGIFLSAELTAILNLSTAFLLIALYGNYRPKQLILATILTSIIFGIIANQAAFENFVIGNLYLSH